MYVNVRDIERLARSLNAQRVDPEYIRHYLQETYQVDDKLIDTVFATVGVGKKKGMAPKGKDAAAKAQPRRREFT
jgi:hypothetical protein